MEYGLCLNEKDMYCKDLMVLILVVMEDGL